MWFKISRLGSFIANWDVLRQWAAICQLHLVSWFIVVLASNASLATFFNVNSHFNLNPTYFIIKQHSILSWSLLNKEKQRQEGKTILCSLQFHHFIATLLTRHLRFICDPSPYFPLYWTSISHKDKVMPKSFKWLIIFAFIVCRPFGNRRWILTMPALHPPFHVPAFRMNLTKFQGIFGVMRRMRNISLLCSRRMQGNAERFSHWANPHPGQDVTTWWPSLFANYNYSWFRIRLVSLFQQPLWRNWPK